MSRRAARIGYAAVAPSASGEADGISNGRGDGRPGFAPNLGARAKAIPPGSRRTRATRRIK